MDMLWPQRLICLSQPHNTKPNPGAPCQALKARGVSWGLNPQLLALNSPRIPEFCASSPALWVLQMQEHPAVCHPAVCQPPSRRREPGSPALPAEQDPTGALIPAWHLGVPWRAPNPSAIPIPGCCSIPAPWSMIPQPVLSVADLLEGWGGWEALSTSPLLESVAPCSGTLLLLSVLLLLLILAFASMISVPRCTT